ncbi:MAG: DUF4055 domain-containing protein [Desulfovibrionaceae bacterium]|nr:DUF4055 domain-containing protein [Desulfovibrionaceae bacterium]MBF0514835.1 DUF4055 domain-containing protein [Desulfovibrionaceae bacterium]
MPMPTDTSKANVNTPCLAFNAMETARELPRTLMGGTVAMRMAGPKYLPKEPAESDQAYAIRQSLSVLYNAYKKAVIDLAGKVFSKAVSCKGETPADILEWCENIDLAGRDLHSFAHSVFIDAFFGVSYIMVDFPRLAVGRTLDEERKVGARPYCVHIKCENLIAWKSERINGVETLTSARIRESSVQPNGDFGETVVNSVRQLELLTQKDGSKKCQFFVWQERTGKDGEKIWVIIPELSGVMSIGFIPLVAIYTDRTDFFAGMPPLTDLADLNALHWQSSSDQQRILHFARFPLLFAKALGDDGNQIEIGPSRMIRASSDQADIKYVEHSGHAIGSGKEALDALEEQMGRMAMAPMIVGRAGTITATEKAIDTSEAHSTLQAWALKLADSLEQVLQYMGAWVGLAPGNCGGVNIDTDYGLFTSGLELPQLTQAFQAGLLSKETVWAELVRRGILSDDFDPVEEMARMENDQRQKPGAALGAGSVVDKMLEASGHKSASTDSTPAASSASAPQLGVAS